jgi:hypothetical protein
VVAVVVTQGEALRLEACLAGLRDSEYPDLTVVVMAPAAVDLRARVAGVSPRAFVRSIADDVGFAAAANDALTTVAGAAFLLICHDDVVVDPGAVPVTWDLYLDDRPWPDESVYAGPYGLLAPVLRKGVASDEARAAAHATAFPPLDATRDLGLFVVRERRAEASDTGVSDEGAEEMARLLKEWGYAQGSK